MKKLILVSAATAAETKARRAKQEAEWEARLNNEIEAEQPFIPRLIIPAILVAAMILKLIL